MQQGLSLGQPPELACGWGCQAPALGKSVQPVFLMRHVWVASSVGCLDGADKDLQGKW